MAHSVSVTLLIRVAVDLVRSMGPERLAQSVDYRSGFGPDALSRVEARIFTAGDDLLASGQELRGNPSPPLSCFDGEGCELKTVS